MKQILNKKKLISNYNKYKVLKVYRMIIKNKNNNNKNKL